MKFVAEIDVMPRPELLDPQGKAVLLGLEHLGLDQVDDVRIGKHITLNLEAETEEIAREKVEKACNKLLANLIMESFTYELKQA
ncbi:phosphoribosylformylglycinamidine synthase subunit PurS [Pontibacter akesuensis]|uniref:Phosphoribosylformylglycinamidine synthase subunit PurS n=1 Tax=Pontibacter akesuensis TaxID=388950 RepID=A0A1I7KAB2_9BACT|nr:phosphoribosylformylglycinamidine synthase subunit PurS [Pontibacter akesuensis]GHA73726.1 phosphoribosylformylglycinamidine synthase subunit PurS [Pontibacter akesuensis]SFU94352.1 phosphoribosylformylglycinamidine synthase [Pontibacter akesuensis]